MGNVNSKNNNKALICGALATSLIIGGGAYAFHVKQKRQQKALEQNSNEKENEKSKSEEKVEIQREPIKTEENFDETFGGKDVSDNELLEKLVQNEKENIENTDKPKEELVNIEENLQEISPAEKELPENEKAAQFFRKSITSYDIETELNLHVNDKKAEQIITTNEKTEQIITPTDGMIECMKETPEFSEVTSNSTEQAGGVLLTEKISNIECLETVENLRMSVRCRKYNVEQIENIDEKYDFGKELYHSDKNIVFATSEKNLNSFTSACKILEKKKCLNMILDFENEVEFLKQLDNDYVLPLLNAFEDESKCYLFTPIFEENLIQRLSKHREGIFTEQLASSYMKQMLEIIDYLHTENIVHRNLSPDVFVFSSSEDKLLKLTDFSQAKEVKNSEKYDFELVGSPEYFSPELAVNFGEHTGKALKQADLWAVGVISYLFRVGRLPFSGKTNTEILHNVVHMRLLFPVNYHISPMFQDFARFLLHKDGEQRFNIPQALEHNWIKTEHKLEKEIHLNVQKLLQQFTHQSEFKKRITLLLSKQLPLKYRQIIENSFNEIDVDKNHKINIPEFKKVFQKFGFSENKSRGQAFKCMQNLDTNRDGVLDLTEFILAFERFFLTESDNYVEQVFGIFDKDKNHSIDAEEIHAIFKNLDTEEINTLINEIDANNDGLIDYDEFSNAMKEISPQKFVSMSKTQLARKNLVNPKILERNLTISLQASAIISE